MIAAVSVGLGIRYVVLFLDQDQVGLFFESILKMPDILLKETDDADSGNILQQALGVADASV